MRTIAVAFFALTVAAGCQSKGKGSSPCSGGLSLETVPVPSTYRVEGAGTLSFEAGKKPAFAPQAGGPELARFQEIYDETMKGDGAVSLRYERMEGDTRHHCGASFEPSSKDYAAAVVTYFRYERGMFKVAPAEPGDVPPPKPAVGDPIATALADKWLDALEKQDMEAWKSVLTDEVKAHYADDMAKHLAGWRADIGNRLSALRAATKKFDKDPATLADGERTHLVFVGVDSAQRSMDTRVEVKKVGGKMLLDDK